MQSVLSAWTAQISGLTSYLLLFAGAVAVLALIGVAIKAFLSDPERGLGDVVMRMAAIVGFCIVAALARQIVAGVLV